MDINYEGFFPDRIGRTRNTEMVRCPSVPLTDAERERVAGVLLEYGPMIKFHIHTYMLKYSYLFTYITDGDVLNGLVVGPVSNAVRNYNPARGKMITLVGHVVKRVLFGTDGWRFARRNKTTPGWSINSPTDDDKQDKLHPVAPANEPPPLDRDPETRRRLTRIINTLPPRTAQAIKERFYEGRQLADIGADLGVTRQCAHELIKTGLRQLRKKMILSR